MKTWSLPAEPNREVTRVRGASGKTYIRSGLSFWRGGRMTWIAENKIAPAVWKLTGERP